MKRIKTMALVLLLVGLTGVAKAEGESPARALKTEAKMKAQLCHHISSLQLADFNLEDETVDIHFQCNADGGTSVGGQQNTVQPFWSIGGQFLRKLNGLFVGISSGRKRKFLKLPHEGTHHFGMGKSHLVDIVPMKIEISLPRNAFQTRAFTIF